MRIFCKTSFKIMTLMRLKAAPFVLIEDNENTNNIPLVLELSPQDKTVLHLFCYEKLIALWENVFRNQCNVLFHEVINTDCLEKYTKEKCSIVIDSVNQMSLILGWNTCLKVLNKFKASPNVNKLILILHIDCLSYVSNLRMNLNHIASAIISFDPTDSSKLNILMKKNGKVMKHNEILSYDARTSTLKLTPIVLHKKDESEPEKPEPEKLTTFKIEVDQTDKLEKYKLKLPYMNKINEGESKIFYEPDAVDDWDDEDPDEDLDL